MSAARSRMTMSAHVQRNSVETAQDAWNSPPVREWADTGDPVPCYAYAMPGAADAVKVADSGKVAVVEQFRVLTPLDADMSVKDRISKITDRRGKTLFDGPLTIDVGRAMPSHLEWDTAKGRPV